MCSLNICKALNDDLRTLPSTYEFKLKVNINVRCLHLLKFGYVVVLGVILFVVYYTGGWNYKDNGVSSLVIKVKGSDLSNGEIWDAVDYVYPPQEVNAFFITTRAVTTKQTQRTCPDKSSKTRCTTHSDCTRNKTTNNGIMTGKCDFESGTCIITAWCPIEDKRSNSTKIAYIHSALNFTVYVRDHEEFTKFNKSTCNDLRSERSSKNCLYNAVTNSTCPTFKISEILKLTNVNFADVKDKGGVFQFYIKWHCYFNWNSLPCDPKYSFKRIAKDSSGKFTGYKMRYAIYQNYNGVRHRDLITVYGLRFLIMVKSTGEQFRFPSFMSNVGSYLSYFGIWTFITGVVIAMCLADKKDLLKLDETALSKIVRSRNSDGDVINEQYERSPSNEHKIALVSL